MDRVPSFPMEQPLDLSTQSPNISTSLYYNNCPYITCDLDSRLYSHSRKYTVAAVSPSIDDNSTDYSCNEPISLVSPRLEPESSTAPQKPKRRLSVGNIVDKSSLEYRKKRMKNNEAARKSRQKKKENEVELKRKMSHLRDENTSLKETVNQLHFLLINQKCSHCSHRSTDNLFRYNKILSLGIADCHSSPSSTQKS